MSRLGNLAQKAFYLGVGLASLAADKASEQLADLQEQAQSVADELVERGEMTAEEGRKFVDNFVKRELDRADGASGERASNQQEDYSPRIIDIDAEEEGDREPPSEVERLRQEIAELQAKLDRLRG
ncbi:phasin family protein [Synechococcus sp. PCC 7336]|uniref:phasin family protein n=1 Tax=Synechococcus sp. PCC 7336 TaxID=195250 RepID=UPI000345F1B4|nr:hypothetical protein [Synechococcus sp. PCC 7336]